MGTPERSMPSDALTVVRTSHWRHTAFGMPKQTSIAAEQSRCGCEDATRAQPVSTILLPREPADRITKRQHAPRAALRRADSDRAGVCVIGDATCDAGHGQALGQVCSASAMD